MGLMFDWSSEISSIHRRSACSNSCLHIGQSSCSCWTFLNAVWSLVDGSRGSSPPERLAAFVAMIPRDHETKFWNIIEFGFKNPCFIISSMEIWFFDLKQQIGDSDKWLTLESHSSAPQPARHWSSWGDASGKLPTELRVLLAGPELEPGGYTGCKLQWKWCRRDEHLPKKEDV